MEEILAAGPHFYSNSAGIYQFLHVPSQKRSNQCVSVLSLNFGSIKIEELDRAAGKMLKSSSLYLRFLTRLLVSSNASAVAFFLETWPSQKNYCWCLTLPVRLLISCFELGRSACNWVPLFRGDPHLKEL